MTKQQQTHLPLSLCTCCSFLPGTSLTLLFTRLLLPVFFSSAEFTNHPRRIPCFFQTEFPHRILYFGDIDHSFIFTFLWINEYLSSSSFHTVHRFSQQEYWTQFIPPPVDPVLSEPFTMTPSILGSPAPSMAHSFLELCKPLHHDKTGNNRIFPTVIRIKRAGAVPCLSPMSCKPSKTFNI